MTIESTLNKINTCASDVESHALQEKADHVLKIAKKNSSEFPFTVTFRAAEDIDIEFITNLFGDDVLTDWWSESLEKNWITLTIFDNSKQWLLHEEGKDPLIAPKAPEFNKLINNYSQINENARLKIGIGGSRMKKNSKVIFLRGKSQVEVGEHSEILIIDWRQSSDWNKYAITQIENLTSKAVAVIIIKDLEDRTSLRLIDEFRNKIILWNYSNNKYISSQSQLKSQFNKLHEIARRYHVNKRAASLLETITQEHLKQESDCVNELATLNRKSKELTNAKSDADAVSTEILNRFNDFSDNVQSLVDKLTEERVSETGLIKTTIKKWADELTPKNLVKVENHSNIDPEERGLMPLLGKMLNPEDIYQVKEKWLKEKEEKLNRIMIEESQRTIRTLTNYVESLVEKIKQLQGQQSADILENVMPLPEATDITHSISLSEPIELNEKLKLPRDSLWAHISGARALAMGLLMPIMLLGFLGVIKMADVKKEPAFPILFAVIIVLMIFYKRWESNKDRAVKQSEGITSLSGKINLLLLKKLDRFEAVHNNVIKDFITNTSHVLQNPQHYKILNSDNNVELRNALSSCQKNISDLEINQRKWLEMLELSNELKSKLSELQNTTESDIASMKGM